MDAQPPLPRADDANRASIIIVTVTEEGNVYGAFHIFVIL